MKILFVVPRYHTNMTGWVKALISAGHRVEVHATLRGYTENYDEIKPIVFEDSAISKLLTKIGKNGINSPKSFPPAYKYYKFLKANKPDYIIVRDISRYFSLLAALLAKILGIKTVIYSQALLNEKYSLKRQASFNFINWFFDSKWMTPLEGRSIPKKSDNVPSKMVFVPFAVTEIIFKNEFFYKNETKQILSIGKFVPRKCHLLLLESIKDMLSQGYKLHLTLVGEKSSDLHEIEFQKVVNYIDQYNLNEFVTLKTNIPHNEIGSLYKANDLFVLPAEKEPVGIVVLEAMGYGLPVVCSTSCGAKYYIDDDITGCIFEENSKIDLVKAIKWSYDDKNMKVFVKEGSKKIVSRISTQAFLSEFESKILR
ncbi:glycosyltransferase family 4 protein [Wenyingzhuangia sp. IMCC45533]